MSLRIRLYLSLVAGLLFAPGVAKADPISVAILAAVGTSTATALAVSVVTFIVTSVITIGLSLLVNALFGPKRREQERQASVLQLNLGEVPREMLGGDTVTGGSLIDAGYYGGTYGTDWNLFIIAVADHKCHSLVGFYVNDDFVTFAADGAVSGYNGQLEVYWRDGSATQTLPSIVTNIGWPTTGVLGGVAHVIVAYKADDPKSAEPTWSGGRPAFQWRVKGKFCYDPRKDMTVGGSGAHRWATPSTWEWTDNLSVIRYNWVRGVYAKDLVAQPEMLLAGRGLTSLEAPESHVFAYANLCDETVALAAGGTVKRYTFNGVIRSDDQFVAVERKFADCCGGQIVQRDGAVEVEPGAAKSVVVTLTDDDFVAGTEVQFSSFRSAADRQWVNTVVPRYVEPEQRWQDHAAPVRRDTADVTADKQPREQTLSLTGVTNDNQAQRVGEIARRMGRLVATGSGTVPPRLAGLVENDWIAWTSARRFGGATKTFRIEAHSRGVDWRNAMQLREIASSVFGWTTADEKTDGAVAIDGTPPPADYQAAYDVLPVQATIRSSFIVTGGTAVLTGRDATGTAVIDVAAHTWDYPDPTTDCTRTSGTISSGVLFSTTGSPRTYYCYFDDATLTNSSPTYAATTTYDDARNTTAHPYRHYLGAVTMPVAGGGSTGGTGGGGGGGGGPIP